MSQGCTNREQFSLSAAFEEATREEYLDEPTKYKDVPADLYLPASTFEGFPYIPGNFFDQILLDEKYQEISLPSPPAQQPSTDD